MLGQDNPIRHYGEVVLFEDELGDKGFSKVNVRYRVMDDCFFILHGLIPDKPIEIIRDF